MWSLVEYRSESTRRCISGSHNYHAFTSFHVKGIGDVCDRSQNILITVHCWTPGRPSNDNCKSNYPYSSRSRGSCMELTFADPVFFAADFCSIALYSTFLITEAFCCFCFGYFSHVSVAFMFGDSVWSGLPIWPATFLPILYLQYTSVPASFSFFSDICE